MNKTVRPKILVKNARLRWVNGHKFLKKKVIFELYIKVFLKKKEKKGEKSYMAQGKTSEKRKLKLFRKKA